MHAIKRLAFGLALCAGLLLQGCGEQAITKEERALLLTVADLAPYLGGPHDESRGRFSKTVVPLLESEELSYVFEYDKVGQESPVYLNYNVKIASKWLGDSDNSAKEVGIDIGLALGKLKRVPLENFPRYGDRSSMSLLTLDERPVGNLFTVQYGQKSAMLLMSGLYARDPVAWEKIIGGKLRLLKGFEVQKSEN